MILIVSLLGVLLLAVGFVILASPGLMRRVLGSAVRPWTLPLFAIIRIGFGVVLVMASSDTRLPVFVWAFGLLLIVAGVSLPLLGIQRVMRMSEWWKAKPDRALRGWALLTLLLGALLLWSST